MKHHLFAFGMMFMVVLLLVSGCPNPLSPIVSDSMKPEKKAIILSISNQISMSEHRITSSDAWETTPLLSNDGVSDIVAYTSRLLLPDGSFTPGDIWFQRLSGGATNGSAVPVPSLPQQDNRLGDISCDGVVFTAHDISSSTGQVMLYGFADGMSDAIASAVVICEPRIYGHYVIWGQGSQNGSGADQIILYDVKDPGGPIRFHAGPTPPALDGDIGAKLIVWSELIGDQYDIDAFGLRSLEIPAPVPGPPANVTDTKADERAPSTYGYWMAWQATDKDSTTSRIELMNDYSLEPPLVITDDGFRPRVDGDFVCYESTRSGNRDIYLYRISTGETFQITTDPADQYLNDIFGNMIAYVDARSGNEDIYVTIFSFEVGPALESVEEAIASMDTASFINGNMKNALSNKLNAVFLDIEQGLYTAALDKLENDILRKTDGCATSGAPDNNDWITNCTDQQQLYPLILHLIAMVQAMG